MFRRKEITEIKSVTSAKKSIIQELKTINEVSAYCTDNSTIIFDLDNVIIEPTQELGSDQWFSKLLHYACEIILDTPDAITTTLTIYHAIQHHIEMQLVEREVSDLIKELHAKSIPFIGLTARGYPIMERTLAQLNKLDIHFSKLATTKSFEFTINEKSPPIIYKDGIIFCNGNDKGLCLAKFFKMIEYTPKHVVMIDDKESHLASVSTSMPCDFIGLRYGYLDNKVRTIDMRKAASQLTELESQLTPETKAAITKLSPLLRNSAIATTATTPAMESKALPTVTNTK